MKTKAHHPRTFAPIPIWLYCGVVDARTIAIETSGRIGSVALVESGGLLHERTFPTGLRHAAELIPLVDALMREHGWTARGLAGLYISIGPGSFTGLRIGVTFAKTLALATGAWIVAVPTARVLVENAPPGAHHAAVILDARRGQVFAARYERAGTGWMEHEPAHLEPIGPFLERAPRPLHLLGEGVEAHRDLLPRDSRVVITSPSLWQPRASVVATVGRPLAARGEFADPDQLAPLYLRQPEAQEKYEAQQRVLRPDPE